MHNQRLSNSVLFMVWHHESLFLKILAQQNEVLKQSDTISLYLVNYVESPIYETHKSLFKTQ